MPLRLELCWRTFIWNVLFFQLINKFDDLHFTKNDENFVEAFAIFCGMGIHNTHMWVYIICVFTFWNVHSFCGCEQISLSQKPLFTCTENLTLCMQFSSSFIIIPFGELLVTNLFLSFCIQHFPSPRILHDINFGDWKSKYSPAHVSICFGITSLMLFCWVTKNEIHSLMWCYFYNRLCSNSLEYNP